jgi:RNA polymerase primary sigma factor
MATSAIARRQTTPSDVLSAYLDDISAYSLLSLTEEAELGRRIRAGDSAAIDALVCANLRFVVSVAKKYRHRSVSMMDLINEGNLGLMRAASRFDESKGVRFVSYAIWWVRQAMIQMLADQGHAVRVPVNRAGVVLRIERRSDRLRQELGREPTTREIATELDLTEADVADTITVTRPAVSLDAPLPDAEATLLDYLPGDADVGDVPPEQNIAERVGAAVETLPPREAQIIRLYFGLDGDEPMTLDEIGSVMGITRERVRQMKGRALGRIRRSDSGLQTLLAEQV